MEEKFDYNDKIKKYIITNIIITFIVIIYFLIINCINLKFSKNILEIYLKVFSQIVLIIGIVIIEYAFKKDNGMVAFAGIETIILAFFTLTISHFVMVLKMNFVTYMFISGFFVCIYYIMKSIILYTDGRRRYLKSLSDIKEIVEKKPVKKKAKKKKD